MSAVASVVIPVHRMIPRLEACLTALRESGMGVPVEVVLSLDGDVPLPAGIASLADLVVTGPSTGPAGARNRGWRASSGRFILFTDSDCVPQPGWAGSLVAALEAGASGAKGVYSSGGRAMIQRLAQVEFEQRYRMLAKAPVLDMVDTYAGGFRREALEQVSGFDESYTAANSEDVDLSYRLLRAGHRLVFVPGARVEHDHRGSWAGYFCLKRSRGKWRMEVIRRFPRKAVSDSYTPRTLKLQMILAGLLPAVAAASIALPVTAAAWAALFLVSCGPLAVASIATDPETLPYIPAFAFVRAAALVSGALEGLARPEDDVRAGRKS